MPVTVYTPGCWDLLHVGHIRFLQAAKDLGDRLIVGVASDEVIREDKFRSPVIPLNQRVEMLTALECVEIVIPYYQLRFKQHLQLFNPNILAVGQFWGSDFRHQEAEDWIEAFDRQLVRIPYSQATSTTGIIERIRHGLDC